MAGSLDEALSGLMSALEDCRGHYPELLKLDEQIHSLSALVEVSTAGRGAVPAGWASACVSVCDDESSHSMAQFAIRLDTSKDFLNVDCHSHTKLVRSCLLLKTAFHRRLRCTLERR